MLVPMKWLNKYVKMDLPVADYAARMIMSGSEVEGWTEQGEGLTGVVVGLVEQMEDHPDSDHLHILQVNTGDEKLQIVCGAPNVFAGARVPVAKIGAVLPGDFKIKRSKIRGVESFGMCCSGQELGMTEADIAGAEVDGLLILPEDTPLGQDIRKVVGWDDVVVEFKSLANRPDCMSVIGMARETAVTLGEKLTLPEISVQENGEDIHDYVTASVEDADLCPRYMLRMVKNVKVGPSPDWMQKALSASSVRPINNIVDVTNYVMLEMGQPLHAYDMAYVAGPKIIVRRAKAGETIRTLDGKDHALKENMLMICDGDGPTGVAGIMGGEHSEIVDGTQNVLLEAAYFSGFNIRHTARELGIRTEASTRFEKGLDIYNTEKALDRAAQLIAQMGAGEIVGGKIDLRGELPAAKTVLAPCARIRALTGVDIPSGEMVRILNELEIATTLDERSDTLHCTVPTHRGDIDHMADIAEEVLRIYGYDKIPATLMDGALMRGGLTREQQLGDKVRDVLVGLNLYEAMSYSFISPDWIEKLGVPQGHAARHLLRISNPLGEDMSVMRTTMAPSLLNLVSLNQRQRAGEIRMFEMGKVYLPTQENPLEGQPDERPTLGMVLLSAQDDFFTLKGIIEQMAQDFGIEELSFNAQGECWYHPGRKATVSAGGKVLGQLGQVHPDVCEAFGVKGEVLLAEIDLQSWYAASSEARSFEALPRFPGVSRDLAVVVDSIQPVGPMMESIRKGGKPLLAELQLFDVYQGAQLPEGKKSVAFSLLFRSSERTLVDEEVNKAFKKIVSRLEHEYGAELRA